MASPPFRRGDGVEAGHGLTAQGLYLFDHPVGRVGGTGPGPIPGAAQVVDHHPGAPFGQFQGIDPAQAGPGPGDDGHAAVEADLFLGDFPVFEKAVVNDHLTGLRVEDPPQGQALVDLPDKGFDRDSPDRGDCGSG